MVTPRRWLSVLAGMPLLCGCFVTTAAKDSSARHRALTDAQKTCWELPRERVFETAKDVLATYRSYHVYQSDLAKGLLETYARKDPGQPGGPERSHRIVVKLVDEPSCTRVIVTAPVSLYTEKHGHYELGENSEGILRDVQLKLHEALRASTKSAPP